MTTVKNMGFVKEETCRWQKRIKLRENDDTQALIQNLQFQEQVQMHRTDLQIDWWLRLVGELQVGSEIDDLKRLHIGNKFPCKMSQKLEMGVLIAIANDLDDPIFTLQGKGL